MEIILTKKEAVEKYGTDSQKSHFEKYKRFNNKRMENALIKTMKQYYESVEKFYPPNSKAYVYKLEGERGIPVEREDGRKNSGKKLEYQYQLNSLVLDYLRKECSHRYFTPNSLSKWLIGAGIVSEHLSHAQFSQENQQRHLQNLRNDFPNEFTSNSLIPIINFSKIEMKRLKQNLATLFNNLQKLELIKYKKEPMGCRLDDTQRPLTKDEISQIKKIRRNLFIKHNLTERDLYMDDIHTKFQMFNEDFRIALGTKFGLKYIYKSHSIRWINGVVATRKIIYKLIEEDKLDCQYDQYLLSGESFDRLLFQLKMLFGNKSLELAEKRERKNYDNEHSMIVYLKYTGKYTMVWRKMLDYFELSDNLFAIQDNEEDDGWGVG